MNEEHPIQGLMTTAMNSIKEMVDVNTIVGDAVESVDGTVIIPISRVSFGFAAGGGEYSTKEGWTKGENSEDESQQPKMPFGGGSGAGVSINPVGFLVVGQNQIRLLPVGNNSSIDRLLDTAPELLTKLNEVLRVKTTKKKRSETTLDGDMIEEEHTNQ